MSTENPVDGVDTTTTTTGHEETHLDDGTLLEEMKKAAKQSASVCIPTQSSFAHFCPKSRVLFCRC